MSNAVQVLRQDVLGTRGAFMASLADTSIKFEQEAGFAVQTIQSNDYLAKIALGNRQSLINAVTNIAAIGISLNPAKKQAYLVPRDGKVCLDISYMGLMDLAMATGAILWGQALIVRERDEFALTGLDQKPHHAFSPFAKDRGEIVGVYVVIKTHHGDYLTHAMDIASVYAIRDRSSAWKSGKKCPWHTDEGEMIKKTCVKQAYKYWPKNARLETAIHHMNTDGGEGLDFSPKPGSAAEFAASQEPEDTPERSALIAELDGIAKGGNMDSLRARWEAIGKPGRKSVGAAEWERIKGLCEHGDVIEGQSQEVPE
jgi:recombination protein RecT